MLPWRGAALASRILFAAVSAWALALLLDLDEGRVNPTVFVFFTALSRIPLGIVIVGGVLFSLILTLFVIPAMYSYLSRAKKHVDFDSGDKTEIHKELAYES